ncbi:hypothetical protein JCM19231_5584 [Vibrio ishigakensis]|uniref:Uncharacterized protein n=1 Tax=Vibrio ishigakensis TaxID=1481914 RepID=A0A0B8NIT4_9VIBR|nr:hypothetical protein JCM19231_5584 [Vibrio ishigakensis]
MSIDIETEPLAITLLFSRLLDQVAGLLDEQGSAPNSR